MPPRYAYWTILIDGQATAFRAREREELLPTFNQLARKNANIVMRYFARGRLWDNPEQAQWESRNRPTTRTERRDREWRPGGEHKDPRARFEKGAGRAGRPRAAGWAGKAGEAGKAGGAGEAGWARKPERRPRFEGRVDKPEHVAPHEQRRERPKWLAKSKWQDKPGWQNKPKGHAKPKWRPQPEEPGKPESGQWRDRKFAAREGDRPKRWNRAPKRKPR